MKLGLIVICSLMLLVIVGASAIKCPHGNKNECECVQKVLRASTVPPFAFCKMKVCEETYPVEFQPIKDVCSCIDLASVRPERPPKDEKPLFAPDISCECGFKDSHQLPKKYFADPVSQHLANMAARKKQVSVSEADLHFQGHAIKVKPLAKPPPNVMEERLHKFNGQVIELKPSRKNRIYQPVSSEEEEFPCNPKQQTYGDICYDKVSDPTPMFEQIKPCDSPCELCEDNKPHNESDDYDEDDEDDEDDEEDYSN
ncbi:uncharacterized protein LOC129731615 [Wyeomyia smithii]|uniref:uncharacterized protein LOC129731615 n=1 Tax=Wyeomyia smithii TaxID=174621 RepID=UPI002467D056|nr:uncharacterized protein LOC129731615 [Wyeomyia smithii]